MAHCRLGSTGFQRRFRKRFRRKFWEALVQSQVRFNRIPEKIPAKARVAQSQVRFNRVPEKVPKKVWEALAQSQITFNKIYDHLIHGNPAENFPVLDLIIYFRKIYKNKIWRLLGIPSKFIYLFFNFYFFFEFILF